MNLKRLSAVLAPVYGGAGVAILITYGDPFGIVCVTFGGLLLWVSQK